MKQMHILPLLAAVLIATLHTPLRAAPPPWTTVLDRAEFALSDSPRPPGDAVAWTPVALPDEWRRTISGFGGQGWYRMRVDLAQAPTTIHAIFVKYRRAHQIDYFVNGEQVGGSLDVTTTYRRGTLLRTPVFVTVPTYLLRAGENVLHVRMQATSGATEMHGLGPVTFGEAREVRKEYIRIVEQESAALGTFFAIAFAAGLIAICLWLARRSDRVMLLLALTYLTWAFACAWHQPFRWVELPLPLHNMSQVFLSYGLPPLAVILSLRTAGLMWPRFEATLWAYLLVETTFPLWSPGGEWRLVWEAANTALLLAGTAIILTHAKRPLRWAVNLQIVTLFVMAALMFTEFMRYFGWVDIENPIMRHYHVPLMMVGIGAAVFEYHVLTVWRAQKLNVELERRVAEKAREIEADHARVEEALREQALAHERQRIITDMHDGLGASLVALLRYVQDTPGDPQVEQRVREALQELRIAIDALEPSDGDLGAVLGNLRHRLQPLLEPTGIRLEWAIAELPRIGGLEPSSVFALQRIMLEAVANARQHAGAAHIRVSGHPTAGGGAEIRIEDDGCGFDLTQVAPGSGLANMHARAARLGAQLQVSSHPGAGTVIRLLLPHALAKPADDQVSEEPDPRAMRNFVVAGGAA